MSEGGLIHCLNVINAESSPFWFETHTFYCCVACRRKKIAYASRKWLRATAMEHKELMKIYDLSYELNSNFCKESRPAKKTAFC